MIRAAALLLVLCAACGRAAPAEGPAAPIPDVVLVDDFDDGLPPNRLGGTYGPFIPNLEDRTMYCRVVPTAEERIGGEGFGMRVEYDVDSPRPAFGGFWMKVQNFDARPFLALRFHARGDPKGYPAQIGVEIKNAREGDNVTIDLAPEWRSYDIPLSQFDNVTDTSMLTEIVFVVSDRLAKKKVGAFYIDHVRFARPSADKYE